MLDEFWCCLRRSFVPMIRKTIFLKVYRGKMFKISNHNFVRSTLLAIFFTIIEELNWLDSSYNWLIIRSRRFETKQSFREDLYTFFECDFWDYNFRFEYYELTLLIDSLFDLFFLVLYAEEELWAKSVESRWEPSQPTDRLVNRCVINGNA